MGDLTEPVHDGDHRRGAPGADLGLVMYGDFECPYCAAAQSILARVQRRLGDRLLLVFRHFPLQDVHPHALQAAQAAEAAAAQDAFWPMHDALYAGRGRLAERDLLAHAKALGLDRDRFAGELTTGVHLDRIHHDIETAAAAAVTARRASSPTAAGSLARSTPARSSTR